MMDGELGNTSKRGGTVRYECRERVSESERETERGTD